jgi:UDP-N-acetylmuramoylalanine--D-glutamate ligase
MIAVPGFAGRKVAVFGLGRSGLTAARALQAGGAVPVLWDDSVSSRMQAQAQGHLVQDLTVADWSDFSALVLSPGAPLTHPRPHWTVDKARAAGIEVIGDVELFARALQALPRSDRPRVVAITGTNGKSTTTALIGWVLQQAGLEVHIGGNIGIGVLALPAPIARSIYVVEVSSYQLDLTTGFAPDIAILTNVTPDHLDRHGGLDGYVAAKARIFRNARLALVGADESWGREIACELLRKGQATTVVTSLSTPHGNGPEAEDARGPNPAQDAPTETTEIESFATRFPRIEASTAGLFAGGRLQAKLAGARSLPGRHNAQNAAFAWATARALGLTDEQALKGLLTFPGLAHRMEEVGRLGRVRFINDSKATNADAARQALSSYERCYWIAGGRAKDGGIDGLSDLFPRVAEAFLIGEAAEAFADRLDARAHRISGDLASAVGAAYAAAASTGREEVVLLSPAAASFDQYPDFEARGEAFRAAVLALGAQPASAS